MQCVDNKLDHFVLLTDSFIIWETLTLIAFEATVIAETFKRQALAHLKCSDRAAEHFFNLYIKMNAVMM